MNREQARLAGRKRYDGPPCKRGHSGERFVSSANCIRCLYDARNDTRKGMPRPDAKRRRTKQRTSRLAFIRSLKDVPCMDCEGVFHPCVMDFDHREDEQKLFTIAMLGKFVGMERLKAEIAKCDVVCANCHRLRTFNRRGKGLAQRRSFDDT